MIRALILGVLSGAVTSLCPALSAFDEVKINEIYFSGSPTRIENDGFIELYNAGDETAFLDGAMLAQGPDTFAQISYSFPGLPGEANFPIEPGEFVVVAIDAYNFAASDPQSVDLSFADFETFYQFETTPGDNPNVPNMVDALLVGFDWFFEVAWGQITLSTGESWHVRPCLPGQACGNVVVTIDRVTLVDGVEYLHALGDTLPILDNAIDAGAVLGITRYSGYSAERAVPGQDSNNSYHDFAIRPHPSPGSQGTLPVSDDNRPAAVNEFGIVSAYPNPFNSSTTIEFVLPGNAKPNIAVFDVLGRLISNQELGFLSSGTHEHRLTAFSGTGVPLSSGVYFVKISAGGFQDSKSVHYLR